MLLYAALMFALLAVSTAWAAEQPKMSKGAAAQIDALKNIKSSRGAVENKIDSRLFLGVLHRRNDERLAILTDFRFVRPEADGRVPVDIVLTSATGMKPVLEKLAALGAVVNAKSAKFRRVSARAKLEDLEAIAAMGEVRRVRQAMKGYTHGISDAEKERRVASRKLGTADRTKMRDVIAKAVSGATNVSEGDSTHGANEARGFFGSNGTGVKVCVISDGVDSLASLQASQDLPAVDVLPGQAGSGDEGSAMLEIVHDLAPGATLGFASALPDEPTFAQNILDLAADGCNIIVDDIIYLDESPFQDGPVAQSVNTVTTAGVLYFSSAGNEANKDDATSGTWEGDFLASAAADPGPLAGANLHDFGDGGNSILVEAGSGSTPVLMIWAEHFDLATGNASTDFDIYDMDGGLTTIFDASTDVQDGAGGDDFPIEFISGGAFTGERLLIDRFAAGATSSVPMFNMIVFRGELADALSRPGATRGHSAAAAAFSVAAVPAAGPFGPGEPSGPFPALYTATQLSETFTSDGPRRIILSSAGAELTAGNRTSTGGVVRQKPDIAAADGVQTAAPGFNPFYGTSAAAPHAAAIAALVKSAVPAITPAQMRTALVNSAIDIEAAGVDRDTGAGIVMAHAAMQTAGATPQAFLASGAAVPTQQVGDGDAFIENNETWRLAIPLTNSGGVAATSINAVLSSSTPGITITQPASAYPNLNPAASATNTTPFAFSVGALATCGGTINFTLTVTYTGGPSPQTFNFSLVTGSPGTPVAFSYAGAPVAIPDGADLSGANPGAPVLAPLTVSGITGNIYKVTMSIDGTACSTAIGSTTVGLDHTFVNDLEIKLLGPGGTTTVTAIDNTDGSGNNFCQTVLDDANGTSIQSVVTANAPFTGAFSPAQALAAFNGQAANGTWNLSAQDFFSADTGNIRAFTVNVTPAVCNAPVLTSNVSATKSVTGSPFMPGSTVVYTVVLTNNGTGPQLDNPGNEFSDTIPAGLTVGTPTASSGTVSGAGVNPVTWNGTIPVAGSVTITIPATISSSVAGRVVSNQGTVFYDADGNGTNEATALTDAPGGGPNEPTVFLVLGLAVPTLSPLGAALAAMLLGLVAMFELRRRQAI